MESQIYLFLLISALEYNYNQKTSKAPGPLRTELDHFGPNWTTLDQIGQLWTKLDLFGPNWTTAKLY